MALDTFYYLLDLTTKMPHGSKITRAQLHKGAESFTGGFEHMALLDRINYFVGMGALKADITNENFVVLRRLTKEESQVIPPIHLNLFEPSVESIQELEADINSNQLCSDTIFNLGMQVMELCSKCKFTYPQGSILKYVMQYKDNFAFVHKMRQMSQYAILHNYKGLPVVDVARERTLYDFVGENDLDSIQISVLRNVLANRYTRIVDICDKLIYDKNEVDLLS